MITTKQDVWNNVKRQSKFNLAFDICTHYAAIIDTDLFIVVFNCLMNCPLGLLRSDLYTIMKKEVGL